MLQEAGLSNATLQRERVSIQVVSTMFWINASFGLTLTFLFAALASDRGLLQVSRTGRAVPGDVLNLPTERLGGPTPSAVAAVSALFGRLCAIATAGAGHGYWALVAQLLISDALTLLMLVRAARWPLTRPTLTGVVREMVAFGCSMLGFNLVVTAANNPHVVLLGRGAGPAATGIYTRAYALAGIPQGLPQGAAAHVALPKLSRVQRGQTAQ